MSEPEQPTASEAAKKLAAAIAKLANEGVYQKLGVRVDFVPAGLETLIQMYFDDERAAGRREMTAQATPAPPPDTGGGSEKGSLEPIKILPAPDPSLILR